MEKRLKDFYNNKKKWWEFEEPNKDKYHVVTDFQGGEFGKGRDYTIEQWCLQAMEWCDMDENDELFDYFAKALANKNTLREISELWAIKFRKTIYHLC